MITNIFAADLFRDKVILVTGAAGGIGSATSELLAALGGKLALADCMADAVHSKAAALGAIAICANIASVSDCENIVNTTLKHYGRLDALINCAGIWVEGDSSEATEAEWDRCIDINLKGTFFLCSKAIPLLKESRGAIINISSDAGVVGNAGAAIYCASKGGVTLLSKALAIELAPHGVRVNALCPSDIMSAMLEFQAERYGGGDNAAYFKGLLDHYPQGKHARFIHPDEVAQYIAYLLSPAGEAITGAAVMMDFGVTAGY